MLLAGMRGAAALAMRRSSRLVAQKAASAGSGADAASDKLDATSADATKRPAARGRKRAAKEDASDQKQQPAAAAAANADAAPKKAQAAKKAKNKAAGPTRQLEQSLWDQGFRHVAGIDEAGRGPLAGPVVAAACIIPADVTLEGIDDSKAVSEEQRERLYTQITSHPRIAWAAQVTGREVIDSINILQATLQSMAQAAAALSTPADYLLVDGNRLPQQLPVPAQCVVKGDATCYAIAAASIIAKVTRDRIMLDLHEKYPHYNFAQHKGYGVAAHMAAVKQHGPCPEHRRSFEPIKSMVGWTKPEKPQKK